MFLKIYILRIAFLLSIVQLALTVYLGIQGLTGSEFYSKIFEYSLILSIIPIVFAIFYAFYNTSSYEENLSNGFVNKNTTMDKNNDVVVYLLGIGIFFILFDSFFRLFSLPIWTNAIIPIILSIVILLHKENVNLNLKE